LVGLLVLGAFLINSRERSRKKDQKSAEQQFQNDEKLNKENSGHLGSLDSSYLESLSSDSSTDDNDELVTDSHSSDLSSVLDEFEGISNDCILSSIDDDDAETADFDFDDENEKQYDEVGAVSYEQTEGNNGDEQDYNANQQKQFEGEMNNSDNNDSRSYQDDNYFQEIC
jgi:hypothetical protein